MTPEEAREVKLPIFNLKSRIREIGRLASESAPTMNVGWAPGRQAAITRRGLVKLAEAEQTARFNQEALRYAQEHGVDENRGALGVIIERLEARQHELRGEGDDT
jgi:hypothetical protein